MLFFMDTLGTPLSSVSRTPWSSYCLPLFSLLMHRLLFLSLDLNVGVTISICQHNLSKAEQGEQINKVSLVHKTGFIKFFEINYQSVENEVNDGTMLA